MLFHVEAIISGLLREIYLEQLGNPSRKGRLVNDKREIIGVAR